MKVGIAPSNGSSSATAPVKLLFLECSSLFGGWGKPFHQLVTKKRPTCRPVPGFPWFIKSIN